MTHTSVGKMVRALRPIKSELGVIPQGSVGHVLHVDKRYTIDFHGHGVIEISPYAVEVSVHFRQFRLLSPLEALAAAATDEPRTKFRRDDVVRNLRSGELGKVSRIISAGRSGPHVEVLWDDGLLQEVGFGGRGLEKLSPLEGLAMQADVE